MCHSYNKKRIFICPILNLQGCKYEMWIYNKKGDRIETIL